jgi:hypothetical protein
VSWQHFLKILQNYLCRYDTTKAVFVASDEHAFINFVKESVKDVPVYSHEDNYIGNGDSPIHLTVDRGGGY